MFSILIFAVAIGLMVFAVQTTVYADLVTKIGVRFPRVAVKLGDKQFIVQAFLAITVLYLAWRYLNLRVTRVSVWFSNLHFPSLPSTPSLPSFSFQSFRDMEWARIGMWFGIVVASILVATTIVRLFMRKPPFFGLIKPTGKFIGMMFIGILGYTIFNWIWWSVEPMSFSNWFLSRAFWSIPAGFIFVGLVAKLTDGVSSSARTAVRIALAVGLLILITGFVRNRNLVSEPTEGRYSTTSFGGNRTGSRRGFTGFDPVVKGLVTARFQNGPKKILIDIAACESDFNHWTDATHNEVIRSEVPGSSATGVFQILSNTHGDEAARLGLNLEVLTDNIRFAEILFDRKGSTPWKESRDCWINRSGGNSDQLATSQSPIQTVASPSVSTLPPDAYTTRVIAFEVRAGKLWSDRIATGAKQNLQLIWGSKLPVEFKIMAIFNADTPQEYAEEFVVVPGENNMIRKSPEYVRVRSEIETTVLFARMKPQRYGRQY